MRNPTVTDFLDTRLNETDFSTKHILNFLHSGPEEQREEDMPSFDWRNIFNLTDQVARMFNQYGEVRTATLDRKILGYPILWLLDAAHSQHCIGDRALCRTRPSVLQTGASVFHVCSREIVVRPL